ncbi:MAG: host attachment protein [Mariprofundaceae bacterium]|nr:host attachment protein [Mariprofundaceae bacterium]
MERIWILVADKSHAKLYTMNGRAGALALEREWDHEASRKHEQELTSDLPGRAFDRVGDGRHAMGQPVDPKKHEAELFAHQLISEIDRGRTSNEFTHLCLVAPPEFLGLLRKQCSPALEQLISDEVDKNLVFEDSETVRDHLPGAL